MLIRSFAAIAAARLVFAAFAIFAFSAAAGAQPQFITYVSATGNDANPCTAQSAPCRTLQRGVNVTPAGGELRLLTPIHGNVAVAKSITIFGNGATIIGVISINNASAVVALRDLTLNGRHAFGTGINILAAAAVHIEDCTIERYTGEGIFLSGSTATKLFVSETVSRDNGDIGLMAFNVNARVAVEYSRFENNGGSGLFIKAAKVNVLRSTVSGNHYGVHLDGGTANFTETTVADNVNTGIEFEGTASVTLASLVVRGNNTGLSVASTAAVSLTGSIITSNPNYAIVNLGTLHTLQNNTLGGNYSGNAAIPYAAF
jgi:hypothetical protein